MAERDEKRKVSMIGWSSPRAISLGVATFALLLAAFIGSAIDSGTTLTVLAVIVFAVVLSLHVKACVSLAPTAGGVILLTALLDRTIQSLMGDLPVAPFVTYIDDGVLALAIPFAVIGYLRRRRIRARAIHGSRRANRHVTRTIVPRIAWLGFAVFAVAGVSGQLIGFPNAAGFVLGTWLALKLPLTLFVMLQLHWDAVAIRRLAVVLLGVFVVHVITSGMELIAPDAVRATFGTSAGAARGDLDAIKGIFSHPIHSATFCLFLSCLLGAGPVSKPLRFTGYFAAGVAAAGLRVKTLIDIAAIAVIRVFTVLSSKLRVYALITVAVICAGAFALGFDLIISRFTSVLGRPDSPRLLLLTTGIDITLDRFGLGSGFGTFGSEASRSAYSPVWKQYGLDDVFGFRPEAPRFVTDLSWATVLGEAGIVGAAGMAVALVSIWAVLARRAHELRTPSWALAALCFTTVIIIDSLASPRLYDGFAAAGLGILLTFTSVRTDAPLVLLPRRQTTPST